MLPFRSVSYAASAMERLAAGALQGSRLLLQHIEEQLQQVLCSDLQSHWAEAAPEITLRRPGTPWLCLCP